MNESHAPQPSPLLDSFLKFLEPWNAVFCQHRTLQRAMRLALAHVLTPGCRMISRLISSCGREQRDWSADYKLFNRSPWKPEHLFAPALEACIKHTKDEAFIHVAGDMTHVRKTGRKVAGIHCMRDPMSPPFHVNLIYGLRFLQMTCVLPLYRKDKETSPRSVPVFFQEVPALAKPGKKAGEEEQKTFRQEKKNLGTCFRRWSLSRRCEANSMGKDAQKRCWSH